MAVRTTFRGHARAMRWLAEKGIEALEVRVHTGIHRELREDVERRAPVREGTYKRNIQSSVGTPRKGTLAALNALRPGQKSILGNTAAHAVVLEKGRTRGKSGRLLGSPQAPRGIFGPAVEDMEKRVHGIIREEFRDLGRELERRGHP